MIPLEFLRQFRISGYAIFDLAVAFTGIYLLAPWLSKLFLKFNIHIPKQNWLILTLPLGIAAHLLFGSMTPMTEAFIDTSDHYILKIVILGLLILGMKDIKIIRPRTKKKLRSI